MPGNLWKGTSETDNSNWYNYLWGRLKDGDSLQEMKEYI